MCRFNSRGAGFDRNPMICESRCHPLFPTDLASVETWFANYRTQNTALWDAAARPEAHENCRDGRER